MTTKSPIEQHWTMEAMGPARAQQALSLAGQNPEILTMLNCDEGRAADLCFGFAAADLLDIHQAPYFTHSTDGILAALYAARIQTRLSAKYHPYIITCHYLETAALLSIAGDQELTKRWFEQRKVASSIPAGHDSDEGYHAFYRLAHRTIRDLTGLGRNEVSPPGVIAQQVKNAMLVYTAPNGRQVEYSHFRHLLGMKLWAHTLDMHQRQPSLERTNLGLTTLDQAVSDIYFTPPLYWVRAAYAALKITEERSVVTNAPPCGTKS